MIIYFQECDAMKFGAYLLQNLRCHILEDSYFNNYHRENFKFLHFSGFKIR
jgi:hypothetical protein